MGSITKELEGIKDINSGKQLTPLRLRQQREAVKIIKIEPRWGSVEPKHIYLRKRYRSASAHVSKLRERALWAWDPSLWRGDIRPSLLGGGLWRGAMRKLVQQA